MPRSRPCASIRCAVGRCQNRFANTTTSFHYFPTSPRRRRKWEEFVSSTRLSPFIATKSSRICSCHFKSKCFYRGFKSKKRRIFHTALPTEISEQEPAAEDNPQAVWKTTDHDYIKTMTSPNICKNPTPVDIVENVGKRKKIFLISSDGRLIAQTCDESSLGTDQRSPENEPADLLSDVLVNNGITQVTACTKTEPHDEDSTPFPDAGSLMQIEGVDPSVCALVRIDEGVDVTVKTELCDEQINNELYDDAVLTEEGIGTSDYLESLAQSMYQMQRNGTFCDLVLRISDGCGVSNDLNSVEVHRNVFSAVSENIRNLQEDVLWLDDDVRLVDIHNVVEYAYTGKISNLHRLSVHEIARLSAAANILGVRKCVGYLRFERRKRTYLTMTTNSDSVDHTPEGEDLSTDAYEASVTPPDIDDYLPLHEDLHPVEISEKAGGVREWFDSTDTSEDETEQSCKPKLKMRKTRNPSKLSHETPHNKMQSVKLHQSEAQSTFIDQKNIFPTSPQKGPHPTVSYSCILAALATYESKSVNT